MDRLDTAKRLPLNERMLHQLKHIGSVRRLDLEAALQKIQKLSRDVRRILQDPVRKGYLHQQADFALLLVPGWFACEQLEHRAAQTPNIVEAVHYVVVSLLQQLRSHPVEVLRVDHGLLVKFRIDSPKVSELY